MGAFLCNEWVGIISIAVFIVCSIIAFIDRTSLNGVVIYIFVMAFSAIMLSVHVFALVLNKQGEVQDTYKESATIIDIYETSHYVRVGKVGHYRHSYYIVVQGEETEHKEKFQVKSGTYSQLEEGNKVTLITNTIKTRFTNEIEKTFDWENTEIK